VEELLYDLSLLSESALDKLDEVIHADIRVGQGLLGKGVIAPSLWHLQQWLHRSVIGGGGVWRHGCLRYLLKSVWRVGLVGGC
jgi:hypothetical protein